MSVSGATLLAGALLDGAVRGTVSIGVCALASRFVSSPGIRHGLWTATLVGMPLWPLLGWWRGCWADLAVGDGLVALWAGGVAVGLTALGCGLWALDRQARAAHHVDDILRLSSDERGPYTWGALRPVVLLPASSGGWTAETRRAVLAHEHAHIRRGDWLVRMVVSLCCVLCWPHPLVWWALRQHQRQAELATDALALSQSTLTRTAYARGLLAVARSRRAPFAGLAAVSELAARIDAVLAPPVRPPPRTWLVGLGIVAVLVGLALPPARPAPVILASRTCEPQPPTEMLP